ncbi:MAG TPA: hypothetical protein DCZ84_02285 [Candidatus Vogelbacteria bacterium]|uniref:GDYXXLXY domain-containing protein n=1 Tax=Candidatus Vogelbacteria bacterium RIFOXYD1_FULL_51_18 TaxID=1802440 RepID=A0A1G2QJP9_9BACT|nr:MAG: hypothetical protein UY66_C0001G0043 [Parcubacteria group bacterium GW2011_GWC1_51_35]KKW26033.1 MAG: hypothetical protein UY68_C0001G0026 [Parcubacteria group bacterium GW2011_GWF2_52_12]KKW27667.1 MAG: hypothetical protein UY69_C0008G0030 [Parcubacteria group bacterium GW2011_GWF1_52_5]KKW34825.1 MAG: hypothetical protein UY80_C0005G0013 [Parcubacteria group bacterium GW2011_GWB1_53_43]OHA60835.1 MAG: hypothetical protein A2569_02700 [Candidatus Vogelbacteria bacterium RIFOXYD1_FULL_5
MIPKSTKFILAFALQVIVILGLIILNLSVVEGGTEVFLRIQPVDPRDPLRGDYVSFQYEISRISYYQIRSDSNTSVRNGDELYVVLREGSPYWHVDYASLTMPPVNNGLIFIKGRVVSGGIDPYAPRQELATSTRFIPITQKEFRVSYDIEQYYIPEGAGNNVSFWNKDAGMRVKVDERGKAIPTQLYVDGKKWP